MAKGNNLAREMMNNQAYEKTCRKNALESRDNIIKKQGDVIAQALEIIEHKFRPAWSDSDSVGMAESITEINMMFEALPERIRQADPQRFGKVQLKFCLEHLNNINPKERNFIENLASLPGTSFLSDGRLKWLGSIYGKLNGQTEKK